MQLLHAGWPSFEMAALAESEFRDPPNVSLISLRMGRQQPEEGCTEQQEAFFDLSILYAGEGHTCHISCKINVTLVHILYTLQYVLTIKTYVYKR